MSSFIVLISVTSRISLASCRPTEGESFKREFVLDSLSFPDEFLDPQILSEPGSVHLGETDLAILNDITETSSSLLEPAVDFSTFSIAAEPLCPGAFRYPYCCGVNGCTQTANCQLGEILNCCTAEPNGIANCTPVKGKTASSIPGENSLVGFSAISSTGNFIPDDSLEIVFDTGLGLSA